MIKTIELFAGVGGFRLGLENVNKKEKKEAFRVVWSNQWEPSTRIQHASEVYEKRFKEGIHSSEDIAKVVESDSELIKSNPESKERQIPPHDLLVGGFPCQDYSVARTLNNAGGIKGKKGVLWWSIYNILDMMGGNKPKYLMLENVDRLLKSPSTQRGRDFAIMLSSLSKLGYAVEWRVINAAEYGMPQRRKRVYIMAYKIGTTMYEQIEALSSSKEDKTFDWVSNSGIMNEAFPMTFDTKPIDDVIEKELFQISENMDKYNAKNRPFGNAGVMFKRKFYTGSGKPKYKGKYITLGDILIEESKVPDEYFILDSEKEKWRGLKKGGKQERTTKSGFTYFYSEGPVTYPDALDRASRTIVTGEGGRGASRFKHVVETKSGRLRRLTPLELERLNQFPDYHTKEASDNKRAFFMGNALVVGVVEKLGKSLADRAD